MLLKIQGYDFIVKYSHGKAVPINDCLSSVLPKPGKYIKIITLNIYMLNNQLNASQCAYKILRDHGESHSEKVCQGSDDWDGQQIVQVPQAKYSHTGISKIEIRMVFCSKAVNVLVSFQADTYYTYFTVVLE